MNGKSIFATILRFVLITSGYLKAAAARKREIHN